MTVKDRMVVVMLAIFFLATPLGVFFLSWKWGTVIFGLSALLIAFTLASSSD